MPLSSSTYASILQTRQEDRARLAAGLLTGVNMSPQQAGTAYENFGRVGPGSSWDDIAQLTNQKALEQAQATIDWMVEDPTTNPPLIANELPQIVNFEKAVDEAYRAVNGRGFGVGVRGAWLGTKTWAAGIPKVSEAITLGAAEQDFNDYVQIRSGVAPTDLTTDPNRLLLLMDFARMDDAQQKAEMDARRASYFKAKGSIERIDGYIDQWSREMQASQLGRVTDLTDIRDFRDFMDWSTINGVQGVASILQFALAGYLGGPTGLFSYAYLAELGGMAADKDLVNETDALGRMSLFAGASAAVELIGGVPTAVTGVRQALLRGVYGEVSPAVLERTAKGYVRRLGRSYLRGGVEEFFQEGAQFFLQEFGMEGADFRFTDETLSQALNAAAVGLLAGSLGSVALGTRQQIALERAARQTRDAGLTVKTMEELASVAQQVKLKDSSPKAFNRLMKRFGLDNLKVFYQADTIRAFAEAQGLDLEETLQKLGVDPADFSMAIANGHRIMVSGSGVVQVGLADQANVKTWSENATFRPDGATMVETKAFNELRAQIQSEIDAQAEVGALSPSRQEIVNTFTQDAVAAGYGAEEAGANALLVASFFETAGQMYGSQDVTGVDLFNRLRIQIQREAPDPGAVPSTAAPEPGAAPADAAAAGAGVEGAVPPTVPSMPAAPDMDAEGARQLDQRQLYEPGTRLDANTYDPAQDPDPGAAGRISTRFPTQASSPESAVGDATLRADTQAMRASPDAFAHNATLLTEYPGMEDLAGTPDEVVAQFQERVKNNLLWLYNNAPDVLRERGHKWYDGARHIVDVWSARYGTNDIAIAGTLAALSPQKDWFMNVSLAERVLDTMFFERDTSWSPEMTATFERILSKYPEIRAQIEGRTLQEVIDLGDATLVAAWVRTFSEAYHDPKFAVVSPEGGLLPPAGGSIAWNSLNEIGKAVSVILDPSVEAATVSMGGRHKVRSFFNNIIAPNSTAGDVTIDTHAVAAALLRPLSQATPEVVHAFGTSLPKAQQPEGYRPAKAAGVAGAQGLYGIYADAYRAAAEEVGILPRQMQSITWEAIRLLYTAAQKRPAVGQQINALWAAGEQSYEEMRDASVELAGGFEQPSWAGSDGADADPAGQATYESRVSGGLRSDGARADGERGRAAGRVPARGGWTGARAVDARGADGGRDAAAVSGDGVDVQQPDGDRGDVRRLNQRAAEPVVAVDPDTFVAAARGALSQLGPVAAQVGTSPGDQAFLLDGGLSGYALEGDNIISVFSSPDSPPGVAQRVLQDAVTKGGRRLDGFDTFLPRIYARAGFRAVARTPFVDEYAPTLEGGAGADWDYDFSGRPDVVFMVYDPENASPETDNVVPDYDSGVAAQDEALRTQILTQAIKEVSDFASSQGVDIDLSVRDNETIDLNNIERVTGVPGSGAAVIELLSELADQNELFIEASLAGAARDLLDSIYAEFEVTDFTDLNALEDDDYARITREFRQGNIKSVDKQGTYDRSNPDIYMQGNNGFIQFMEGRLDQGAVIGILKSANQSTLPHELGHFFLEAYLWMATQADAPAQLKKDFAEINRWFGREDDDLSAFSTDHHEMWAESFEKYLATGQAPTTALKSAFWLFKRWLVKVYQATPFLQTELDPRLVDIFDRMLATEEEIEIAKVEESMGPMLLQKPPGMADETYEQYRRAAALSDATGSSTLLERAMQAAIKRESEAFKKKREELTAEYTAGISQQRHIRLVEALKAAGVKLNRDQLVAQFGQQVVDDLARYGRGKNSIVAKSGGDLEVAAELGGYDSVDGMIGDLTANGPLAEMVRDKVNAELANDAEDIMVTGDMRRQAIEALHNSDRWKMLTMEDDEILRMVKQMDPEGTPPPGLSVAETRKLARAIIADTSVQVAQNPEVFLRVERKAAREAQELFGRVVRAAAGNTMGTAARADLMAAHAAKRRQILNSILYAEAKAVEKTVQQIKDQAGRVKKASRKSKKPTIASPYLEQLQSLLAQYDFRKLSAKETWQRHELQQLHQELEKQGLGEFVAFAPDVMKRLERQPYGSLKVSELDQLKATLDNLEHLGRKQLKALVGDQTAAFHEVKRNVITTVQNHFPDTEYATTQTDEEKRKWTAHHVLNTFSTADTILKKLDGSNDDVGYLWSVLKKPISAGMARYQERSHKMRLDVAGIIKRYFGSNAALNTAKIHRPEIGASITRAELVAIALNTGNEENVQRLYASEGAGFTLTEESLQALLDNHMTETDWRFVQDMWDYINSYWGEIAANERRLTGVYPKKVEAQMGVKAPDFVRGGYYPIRYDRRLGANVNEYELNDVFNTLRSGKASKAQTSHGHVEERKRALNKPLERSLTVGIAHLNDVLLDLELREPVQNAWRLLNDVDVQNVFMKKGLDLDRQALTWWLQDVALGERQHASGLSRVLRHMRSGLSVSRMAFSATTIIQQPLGLLQSAVVVGKAQMGKGLMKYLTNPWRYRDAVEEVSSFMVERQRTMERDMALVSGLMDEDPVYSRLTGARRLFVQAGFYAIQKLQYWTVDLPTWVAAYDKALEQGMEGADAVAYADQLVARAQGSGVLSDRTGIERGTLSGDERFNEAARLMTTFGSYMIGGKLNVAIQRMRGTDFTSPAQVANLMTDLLLLYFVETMAALYLTGRFWDPEEDEDLYLWMAGETASAVMSSVPLARDLAGYFQGFGAGGSLGSALETIGGGVEGVGTMAALMAGIEDNEDKTRTAVRDMVGAVGMGFHLPSAQLERWLTATFERDMSVRDDFSARDLAFGRRD